MKNKIFLVMLGFGLVAVGVWSINNNEEASVLVNQAVSQESETEEESDVSLPEEYEVDESDLYVVDETLVSETASLLSVSEEKWLMLMREEEKLARDVYLTLADQWGMRIFSNIASSEQTHTDAVKVLLDRYGLVDPVTDDAIGVFTNLEIQTLYGELTAQGSESLLAALEVGATIEDLDINDLDLAMAENTKADIETVYLNLQKGSRNHMRAFVKQIERQGGVYVPQYISKAAYEDIVSSTQERGRL